MNYFDLQVNGAFGVNFADPELTEDSALRGIEKILQGGTTRFLPTLPTAAMSTYRRNLPLLTRLIDSHGLRYALPGFHLEGPFISRKPGAVGAHVPEWVQDPNLDSLKEMIELSEGKVSILTVAAELPGIQPLIQYAHSCGITVSLGHQLATEEEIRNARADTMTHLGNGAPNLLDRHRNMIWAGLAYDEMPIMAIIDGHHLPVNVLKCYLRCKGVDKFIAVSDACNVAGLPPGKYYAYGNNAVLEPNGLFHNPEKHCLVGSSMLLPQCADVLRNNHLLSEPEIEKVCWTNPHRLLGLSPEK